MLRRAHIAGLILAAVALPALAADFVVNGNVNVAGQEGAPGILTVNGKIVFPSTLSSANPLFVFPVPGYDVPICNTVSIGQMGVGLYPMYSKEEYDAVLWFCGVVRKGGQDTPQRWIIPMQYWPETGSKQRASSPRATEARADTAALAARVATLEKQLAALKAVACRDHAAEAACR